MKTIKCTGPLLYQVMTEKMPEVPRGKVHIRFVRYETLEFDANCKEFKHMQFNVHDANCEEAKEIANLVNS